MLREVGTGGGKADGEGTAGRVPSRVLSAKRAATTQPSTLWAMATPVASWPREGPGEGDLISGRVASPAGMGALFFAAVGEVELVPGSSEGRCQSSQGGWGGLTPLGHL